MADRSDTEAATRLAVLIRNFRYLQAQVVTALADTTALPGDEILIEIRRQFEEINREVNERLDILVLQMETVQAKIALDNFRATIEAIREG
ncbi:hypothetical protein DSL72_003640 [Monilinia vaccinii-corymbosi]|uniref:Uncharacterized protein n=1 Tax=Monilinia vaccinii-corymbosi TaxID=61207 RepID=A0A8A3NYF4_9HELO|nr:hypothetical protein DSL72_003640 [Monilinia vaccinii-corymbosi]